MGQCKMIQRWVSEGGGLVVLGGMMALGQGGNMERGWPEMLPVRLNAPFEIRRCSPPVPFGQAHESLGLGSAAWQKPTVVLYRHLVEARPGATVLLAGADGEPLLVGGTYGKGRVVVISGTVLGTAGQGQAPFWQSPAWPDTLAAALRWCQGATRD